MKTPPGPATTTFTLLHHHKRQVLHTGPANAMKTPPGPATTTFTLGSLGNESEAKISEATLPSPSPHGSAPVTPQSPEAQIFSVGPREPASHPQNYPQFSDVNPSHRRQASPSLPHLQLPSWLGSGKEARTELEQPCGEEARGEVPVSLATLACSILPLQQPPLAPDSQGCFSPTQTALLHVSGSLYRFPASCAMPPLQSGSKDPSVTH